jgi:hypothetical protein
MSERQETQLTLDLLLLRVEGGARSGDCLLQLEDDSFLLLVGLPQVLMGHALLDQLTGEPRDLIVSELDGGLRHLKRGTLPLKMALRFLSGRAFTLEGDLSLLEGGPLLLKLSLRLLARALLLTELLPHHGKRGGLVCQIGPQPLGLLGILLSLALPRSRPLEGGAVLLELGLRRSEHSLPLHRHYLHRGQVLARLQQRLVSCQECGLHHVDCRGALRSLCTLV